MAERQGEDIQLVIASSLELETYLRSKVLFWRLDGSVLPLTPGNLLLAQKRLSENCPDEIKEGLEKIDQIIFGHRTAWIEKLQSESTARLTQWENTIQDYDEEGFIPSSYPSQVRVRVILSLIRGECPYPDLTADRKLESLDDKLRQFLRPGSFIWEPDLAVKFPQNEYWFLYTDLKRKNNGEVLYR